MKHKDEPLWVTKERKKKRIKFFAGMAILAGGIVLTKLSGCTVEQVMETLGYVKPEDRVPKRYFGPVDSAGNERIFDVGEHLVFVYKSMYTEDGAIRMIPAEFAEVPEGYEIENGTITTVDYGDGMHRLYYYINTVPVKAVADEEGKYTTVGTPVLEEELAPVKTK